MWSVTNRHQGTCCFSNYFFNLSIQTRKSCSCSFFLSLCVCFLNACGSFGSVCCITEGLRGDIKWKKLFIFCKNRKQTNMIKMPSALLLETHSNNSDEQFWSNQSGSMLPWTLEVFHLSSLHSHISNKATKTHRQGKFWFHLGKKTPLVKESNPGERLWWWWATGHWLCINGKLKSIWFRFLFQYSVPRKMFGTRWYKCLLCDFPVQNSQLKCPSLTFLYQMMHKHHLPCFYRTVDSAFLKTHPDPSGSLYLSVTHLLAETGRFLPFDDLGVKLNSQCNRNQHNKRN